MDMEQNGMNYEFDSDDPKIPFSESSSKIKTYPFVTPVRGAIKRRIFAFSKHKIKLQTATLKASCAAIKNFNFIGCNRGEIFFTSELGRAGQTRTIWWVQRLRSGGPGEANVVGSETTVVGPARGVVGPAIRQWLTPEMRVVSRTTAVVFPA
ncbi:Uncharacterized protein Adt_34738 [Abeliophyllum distichum]|uniref:Uncharacterized protein n=1 Tax=Abeliophyllum distichum TaxID=126358 RepID=A0ABD1QZZ2_9LAMI